MRLRLLIACVFFVTLSACFSAKPTATSSAGLPPPEAGISPSIFPHKSDWKDSSKHGVYVKDILKMDTVTCLGCHKETDSVSGGAPSCRSCHAQFPHTDPGVTQANHGNYILTHGKTDCATTCHGTDLKGGLSGVACTKCHTIYPHGEAWAAPANHGPTAEGNLKLTNSCNLCHGNDWKGGTSKVSCVGCHKESYPHPEGWAAPEQHGAFVSKNGSGKCATQCHGVQLEGGLSGKACNDCHKLWPHPTTQWMGQHGQVARTIGLSGCTGCHKSDATGGKTGINCIQCHSSLPAHQDIHWGKAGHGKMVMQQPSTLTDPKGCPLCHGAKLEGGKVPTLPGLKAVKGCKDCHASYPAPHKSAAGAAAWETYNGHGKWIPNQVDISKGNLLAQINTLSNECAICHGKDLKGGSTGKNCYSCHANFPHNIDLATSPWISKHGAVASAESPNAASCSTSNCHGAKLEGSNFNGQKFVSGCADCHLKMPHQDAWKSTHGASASVNPNACAKCHGSNWMGSGSAQSCYSVGCHSSYPLPHRNADGSKNLQWTPAIGADFHGALITVAPGATTKDKVKALQCTTCHDSGNNGNPTPSCYTCHPSVPHAPAPVTANGITYTFIDSAWDGLKGIDNSHGQYVSARAKLNAVIETQVIKTECATSCHGTDLKGGSSKKSCLTCHHSADETTWTGKGHGAAATISSVACKTCHGSDLKGSPIAASCATCHGPGTKATLSSHKDITENQTYYDQCCDNCIDSNDWNDPLACTDCASGYYNCGTPKQKTMTTASFVPKIHSDMAKTNTTSCKTCHGNDLKGGISGKSCFSCHNPGGRYPHTKLGPDTVAIWRNLIATKKVPVIAMLQINGGNMNHCYTACHGNPDTPGYKGIILNAQGKNVFDPTPYECWDCHKKP